VIRIGPQHDPKMPSWRPVKPVDMVMPKSLQYWLIASVVVLLGSLVIFVTNVVAGFAYFNSQTSPLWVTVVGVVAVLGIATGFAGLLFVLILAGMKARKNDKARAVSAE
jgi:H+/Cl- antiporter ClcA